MAFTVPESVFSRSFHELNFFGDFKITTVPHLPGANELTHCGVFMPYSNIDQLIWVHIGLSR